MGAIPTVSDSKREASFFSPQSKISFSLGARLKRRNYLTPTTDSLPLEVFALILSFLELPEMFRANLICKSFRLAMENEATWRNRKSLSYRQLKQRESLQFLNAFHFFWIPTITLAALRSSQNDELLASNIHR